MNSEQEQRKSLPQKIIEKEQSKVPRDQLKTKYQEREYQTPAASMNSAHQLQQTPLRTLERMSLSSIDESPKKFSNEVASKSQTQSYTNYQKFTPDREKKKSMASHGSTYKFLSSIVLRS